MTCKKIGADKTYKTEGIENPLILSTQKLLCQLLEEEREKNQNKVNLKKLEDLTS